MKLTWHSSYATIKFNTSDGDLHKNQYAVSTSSVLNRDGTTTVIEKVYIRLAPENNTNFVVMDLDKKMTANEKALKLSTMEQVQIIPNESMYYDEFVMPDGRIYREVSDEKSYKDLGKKDAKPRDPKDFTVAQLDKIKGKDGDWI